MNYEFLQHPVCWIFMNALLMANFPGCFLFSALLFILHMTRTTQQTCEAGSCGDPTFEPSIQYPFYLKGVQNEDCGYPDFEVYCDNLNRTLITLGDAGDFVVKEISFKDHEAWMNDPNACLPSRFLNDLDLRLQDSPFRWSSDYFRFLKVEFLNCTGPSLPDHSSYSPFAHKIPCLSSTHGGGDNFSVVAVSSDSSFRRSSASLPAGCRHISSTFIPVNSLEPEQLWESLYSDIRLKWIEPNCKDPDDDVNGDEPAACYNNFLYAEPRHYKMYKIVAVGVAGTVCFGVAGIARLLGAKVDRNGLPRRRRNVDSERNRAAESVVDVGMGLDESTIEQYPKTQVGESGRLPNPGDNVCSIYLSEYEPRETLRTIPHCNHYFHAHCIDGWLKKKGTCPLCRHLPHHASNSLSLSSPNSRPSSIPT